MGKVPNYFLIIIIIIIIIILYKYKCTAFRNGFFEKCEGINQSIKQTNNIARAHIQNIINSLDLSRVYWVSSYLCNYIFNYIIIKLTLYNLGLIFFLAPGSYYIYIYIVL